MEINNEEEFSKILGQTNAIAGMAIVDGNAWKFGTHASELYQFLMSKLNLDLFTRFRAK